MVPTGLPFIILKERGFVMGDKDKGTRISWMMRIGNAIAVPNLEMGFVICPLINKGLSIGHNIVSFMTVNIHPIFHLVVAPLQFSKPSFCCCQ